MPKVVSISNDCPICGDIQQDENLSGVAALYGTAAMKKCILWENEFLFLIPAPGCFAPVYLILATKSHIFSFAELNQELLLITEKLVNRLLGLLEKRYNCQLIAFEHGMSAEAKRSPKCIDHAHIHITSTSSLIEIHNQLGSFTEPVNIVSLTELKRAINHHSHLWIKAEDDLRIYFSNEFPSQFVRKILANQYGVSDEWDWRCYPFNENFVKLQKEMVGLFAKNEL